MDPANAVNGIVNVLSKVVKIKDNKLSIPASALINNTALIKKPSASVMSRVKDSIGYYPVLVSDSISHNAALLIAKNIEARIAESIKLIIASQNNIVDTSKQDVNTFLKQFQAPNQLNDMGLTRVECDYNGFIESIQIAVLENNDELSAYKKKFLSEAEKSEDKSTQSNSKKSPYKSIDVQKINNLLPTILSVNLKLATPNGSALVDHEAIIAIKANLHIMPSFDVIQILGDRLIDSSTLTRLIRWTTGELKFFRDIVAKYDQIKDIESNGTRGAGVLNYIHFNNEMSKSGAALKKVYSEVVSNEAMIPNTTLVLSKDDILEIKKNTTLDLLAPLHAKRMMKELGVMTFIIIDEAAGSMRLLDDNRADAFDTLPLSDPEKQGGDRDTERLLKAFFSTQKR
jgi:hypothetical protein